ncbi:MAG: hypothetical protein LQ338_005804 [Usnochroma carphineum]|nr:MAG: hypothetical protein LQ338_005804 [Usnochroma carphineum]
MRCNTILLAALGLECALAQPAHHRHHHKQRRDLKDVDWSKVNYNLDDVDWNAVKYGAPAQAAAAPAPAESSPSSNPVQPDTDNHEVKAAQPKVVNVVPVPAQASTASASAQPSQPGSSSQSDTSGGSGVVNGAQGGAQGSFGGQSTPVVTGDRITYIGNVGVPYGSNMMYVPSADGYKYTTTFKNVGQNPLPINVWNKAGRDGQANSGGCTEANLKFTLGAGESQVVAFDENTQAAFSRECDKGAGGYPSCVWGELDFGDQRPTDSTGQGNLRHSGFDRSSIPGGPGEVLTMSCLNCGGGDQTSSREKNAFTSASQLSGGGQANPGPAHFLAELAM